MLLQLALTLTLMAASPIPVAPAPTAIADILANPAWFDGKHLTVNGTVAQLSEKTSKRGNDYSVFDLCAPATSCIHAYSHGHPKIANGQSLTVNGTFFAVKKVGMLEFKNELDADDNSL